MHPKIDFVLKIFKSVPVTQEDHGKMSIIIMRPYAQLEKELTAVFEGQRDVEVIVDRRDGESIPPEISRSERRRSKEEVLDIVLSA